TTSRRRRPSRSGSRSLTTSGSRSSIAHRSVPSACRARRSRLGLRSTSSRRCPSVCSARLRPSLTASASEARWGSTWRWRPCGSTAPAAAATSTSSGGAPKPCTCRTSSARTSRPRRKPMARERPVNTAASVRQRLLNPARPRGAASDLVLSRYSRERFLFRLTQSEHADRFVLKGATLFLVWEGEPHRLTRDLDLLSFGPPDPEQLVATVRAICAVPAPDDGLTFESESVRAASIREDQEYE